MKTGMEPRYFSEQVSSAERFYLRQTPADPMALSVISGGMECCRPEYTIHRPGFSHPIIEFVAEGTGRLELAGRRHALVTGSVFAYSRGIRHRITCDPGRPLTKYFVVLSGKAARDLMRDCRLAPGTVRRVLQPDRIRQVFEDRLRHGRDDHPDRHRMCAVAAQYLIMKIGDLAVPAESVSVSRAFATYLRCRRHISEHYSSIANLNEVARVCHVDLSYLCRLFQRFGRERPGRYLLYLRLNRAAELIQNSDLMIKEISHTLGFSDPYNFSRAFRRAFGIPPGKLRQRS